MIPTGPIYTALRTEMLDTFPVTLRSAATRTRSVSDWIETGTYKVTKCGKTEVVVEAALADLAEIMLAEIELYSNQCFEQLQEIARFSRDDEPRSDAWNVVTAYYFGFYAGHLLLRLIGFPVLFLSSDRLKALITIAGATPANSPHAGTYCFSKRGTTSAVQSEYLVKSVGKRTHEAMWNLLFSHLRKLREDKTVATDLAENVFYDQLTTKTLFPVYKNYEWPSSIRTKANYSAGYAYVLVENRNEVKTKALLDPWRGFTRGKLPQILGEAIMSCDKQSSPYSAHVRLMSDMSMTIFMLARTLYSDLLHRRRLDRRWEGRRNSFRAKMSLSDDVFSQIAVTY